MLVGNQYMLVGNHYMLVGNQYWVFFIFLIFAHMQAENPQNCQIAVGGVLWVSNDL